MPDPLPRKSVRGLFGIPGTKEVRRRATESLIDLADEALTTGTMLGSNPELEAEPPASKDAETYRAIGGFIIAFSGLALVMMVVYGRDPVRGAQASTVFLSFRVPLAAAFITTGKRYLVLALAILGAILARVGSSQSSGASSMWARGPQPRCGSPGRSSGTPGGDWSARSVHEPSGLAPHGARLSVPVRRPLDAGLGM